MLFGAGAVRDETWEWDGVDWGQRSPVVNAAPRYYTALAQDTVRGVTVMVAGLDANGLSVVGAWEYNAFADSSGPGQSSGGSVLSATSRPFVGEQLCVSFTSPVSNGVILLAPGLARRPALNLSLSFLCTTINLYVDPANMLVLQANGNPGTLCLPIPANASLAYADLTLQALAQSGSGCFNASNGLQVQLMAP